MLIPVVFSIRSGICLPRTQYVYLEKRASTLATCCCYVQVYQVVPWYR